MKARPISVLLGLGLTFAGAVVDAGKMQPTVAPSSTPPPDGMTQPPAVAPPLRDGAPGRPAEVSRPPANSRQNFTTRPKEFHSTGFGGGSRTWSGSGNW